MFKSFKGFLASSTAFSPNSQTDSSNTNESPESTNNSGNVNSEGNNSANTNPGGAPESAEGSSAPPQSVTASMYNDAAMISDELKKSLNTAKGL